MNQNFISEPIFKVSEIIGKKVKNNSNEKLGKIIDIVLQKNQGRVAYVVLAVASANFFSIQKKLIALPWNLLKFNFHEDLFYADLIKEELIKTHGIDKNNWPASANIRLGVWVKSFHNALNVEM